MIHVFVGNLKNIKNVVVNNMNNESKDINLIITEILIRLTSIEKLLLDKKIINEEELLNQVKILSESLVETIKKYTNN